MSGRGSRSYDELRFKSKDLLMLAWRWIWLSKNKPFIVESLLISSPPYNQYDSDTT